MADEAVTLRGINWRETFPFTHLFRAFRVAVHPSKLILALTALGCLWCGGLILDAIWLESYEVTTEQTYQLSGDYPSYAAGAEHLVHVPGVFHTFFDYEVQQANDVLMFRGGPWGMCDSTWRFVAWGPLWLWSHHWFFALLYTAWFLLIWSLFGGAISRIAAVHVARDEKISVRHAVSFSANKVLSFIFAPIIPVFIIFVIGAIMGAVATVLLHIPYVGPFILGLSFFLALLGGCIITLVLLGTLGGFNLMYPTVAVEGSDSFDAISRSFSYVFARPWRMLWYTFVAIVYGAICYLFVRFFVWLVLAATWFFVSWFLGGTHVNQPAEVWPHIWPRPVDPLAPLAYTPQYDLLKGTEAAAAGLVVWWTYLVIGLIGAFAISFYFSANTIIYFLMRREVDATELDDVYVEETEEDLEPGAVAPAGTAVAVETTTVRVYESSEPASGGATDPAPATEPTPPPTSPPPAGGV